MPVAIIGSGPVGLASAAQAVERGLPIVILERGPVAASAVRAWGHVRIFSPWRYNVDAAAARLLDGTGWWPSDPEALPTGAELVRDYLAPLAAHPAIAPYLRCNATVESIVREGLDRMTTAGREAAPLLVHWKDGAGRRHSLRARAVIDASGTWHQPNPMGVDGRPVEGEDTVADAIAYGLPNVLGPSRSRYAGRRVLVVGSGHSAANVVLDLIKLQAEVPGTQIVWALRRNRLEKLVGGGLNDQLSARGALGLAAQQAVQSGKVTVLAPYAARTLERVGDAVRVTGTWAHRADERTVDQIVVATGFRPDLAPTRELRVALDPILEAPPALAPLIDPNLHSCGTVPPHGVVELSHPEPGFYIAGSKSYGRAPTFLMATGYEQVRSIVAEIAGDHEAARRVELVLPETGVCTTNGSTVAGACCGAPEQKAVEPVTASAQPQAADGAGAEASAGCCGGPAPEGVNACCVKDADAKAAGEAGCGCGTAAEAPPAVAQPAAKQPTVKFKVVSGGSSCCGSNG